MDITEYGDIVFTDMDEWGRIRINSLLEDGTKIIIVTVVFITAASRLNPAIPARSRAYRRP
jgi:hypothetical protein